MGTMLIISSTPRITYKMGTRAGLGACEDKSLLWLRCGASSGEVAAVVTVSRKFNWRNFTWRRKPLGQALPKYHSNAPSGAVCGIMTHFGRIPKERPEPC